MSVKGTKTEKNLLTAFAGESQARNRYTYFAKVAEKEGYPQIADIFLETADHERVHGKTFFKSLEGGPLEITATYPAGMVGTTLENLQAAAQGEHEEWTILYPEAANIAKSEGFEKIAQLFESIASAESEHEKRFAKLAKNIKDDQVFKKSGTVKWKCRKCGFIHEGAEAPITCPACRHPRKHFEIQAENY